MIIIAFKMVRTGHGLETYKTFWLVEFNWIGFLSFVVATAIALLIGLALRMRHNRELNQLEVKYGKRRKSEA